MMESEITIVGTTATWTLPPTDGDLHGTYTGTFEFRTFLDPIRQLQAGREFRELLGSLNHLVEEPEGKLAFALTQLKHRIIKAPPFWTSTISDGGIAGNIGDTNIIGLVLDAAVMSENLYREKMMSERQGLIKSTVKLAEGKVNNDSGT